MCKPYQDPISLNMCMNVRTLYALSALNSNIRKLLINRRLRMKGMQPIIYKSYCFSLRATQN